MTEAQISNLQWKLGYLIRYSLMGSTNTEIKSERWNIYHSSKSFEYRNVFKARGRRSVGMCQKTPPPAPLMYVDNLCFPDSHTALVKIMQISEFFLLFCFSVCPPSLPVCISYFNTLDNFQE